jgi:hypothetical protein
MKKKFFIILAIALLTLIAAFTYFLYTIKKYSPEDTASYRNNSIAITATYSRPSKKGRLIFGEESAGALQPYGKYWRMGANQATVFSTNRDLMINGQHLKSGQYSMHAYPGKENWQIVLNSDFNRWGNKAPETSTDVLTTLVPANNSAPFSEQFTIIFEPEGSNLVNMKLWWDHTEVKIPLTIHE